MSALKDDCECGHDRCHHYRDPASGKLYNCLAVHCDCKKFDQPAVVRKSVLRPIDRDEAPDTPRTPLHKPHADTNCRCNACIEWTARRLGYIY